MSDRAWTPQREERLEEIIQENLPELPPDDIAAGTTPWRRAMTAALWGVALQTLTLNLWLFGYLLPFLGLVLAILGFRALRRENGCFFACWLISVLQIADLFPVLILKAVIYVGVLPGLETVSAAVNLLANLVKIVCLWRGFLAVRGKVGLSRQARAGAALVLWYLIMCLLALVQYEGIVLFLGICTAYFFILYSLFKLSKELDEAGYAICPAVSRIPGWLTAAVLFGLLAAGIACAYLFGNSVSMDWKPVSETGDSALKETKLHLLELGFPEAVLEDLAPEEIEACEGALRVVADRKEFAMNGDSQAKGNDSVRELCVTGVAVELPGEPKRWKVFHHFQWMADQGFCGTEAIQLWPAYCNLEGWSPLGEVTGRVLCAVDGRELVSPYHFLGEEAYVSDDLFWGRQEKNEVFAEFSMPADSADQRGYLSYSTLELEDSWMVSSWFNYTHQRTWMQYPVRTAKEWTMAGLGNRSSVFLRVQSPLQFYLEENKAF